MDNPPFQLKQSTQAPSTSIIKCLSLFLKMVNKMHVSEITMEFPTNWCGIAIIFLEHSIYKLTFQSSTHGPAQFLHALKEGKMAIRINCFQVLLSA